jgi:hypothetical protein
MVNREFSPRRKYNIFLIVNMIVAISRWPLNIYYFGVAKIIFQYTIISIAKIKNYSYFPVISLNIILYFAIFAEDITPFFSLYSFLFSSGFFSIFLFA